MSIGTVGVILRVLVCCVVFAFFLFAPLRSRFRYNYKKTALMAGILILFTVGITLFFLLPGQRLSGYSLWGIILWIITAVFVFCLAVKGSFLEMAFIVLVILNLYVNIVAVAKVIAGGFNVDFAADLKGAFITLGVLAAYIPLLWILLYRLYRKVIEFDIKFSFWKVIWMLPALTYIIFYVKIVNDYWRSMNSVRVQDIIFVILWSFTTYILFLVTLLMLTGAYQSATAKEEVRLVQMQLKMQEGQYRRLLENIEHMARLRHDWRHHLLTISILAENQETEKLKSYLNGLLPSYLSVKEKNICRNHVVDVILSHYVSMAETDEILVDARVDIPDQVAVPDTDLCILFGNLMENAVEACRHQTEGVKKIEIKVQIKGKQIIVVMRNTYNGRVIKKGDLFVSSKHEGDGTGLVSVKKVVEKYQGYLKISYNKSHFSVSFIMNFY